MDRQREHGSTGLVAAMLPGPCTAERLQALRQQFGADVLAPGSAA